MFNRFGSVLGIAVMDDEARGIDEAIRRAIEAGQFENLPGAGKPLNLTPNPHEDPAWGLSYHFLKENDFTLPWIADRQEIEADLQAARNSLRLAWEHTHTDPARQDEWLRAKDVFSRQLEVLNQRIRDYNLGVPSPGFQRLPLDFNRELQHLTADLP